MEYLEQTEKDIIHRACQAHGFTGSPIFIGRESYKKGAREQHDILIDDCISTIDATYAEFLEKIGETQKQATGNLYHDGFKDAVDKITETINIMRLK